MFICKIFYKFSDFMNSNEEILKNLTNFFKTIGQLKTLKRKGWIQRNISNNIESVADHSFRLSVLSMIFADLLEVDALKVIKMSLIHDFPESIVGDITPSEMDDEKKFNLELEAMKKITNNLGFKKEYFNLWSEFEKGDSEEAKLVKQLDKIEMIFQALEYELAGNDPKKLAEFWDYTEKILSHTNLIDVFQYLNSLRKQH